MIDLEKALLEEVRTILERWVPECQVRAYGSRITGRAWRFSDLDLALMGTDGPLAPERLEALREAFAVSDLPIMVDVQDWSAIPPAFRRVIESRYEVLQAGHPTPSE